MTDNRWRQGVGGPGASPTGAGKFAQPAGPSPAAEAAHGSDAHDDDGPGPGGDYRAYGPGTVPARSPLHVEFIHSDRSRSFTWSDVRGTSCTWDPSGEVKTLAVHFFAFAVVLTGRHLGELKGRLLRHSISWVQVYDSKRHTLPPPGAPVVLSLDVIAADSVPLVLTEATAARGAAPRSEAGR